MRTPESFLSLAHTCRAFWAHMPGCSETVIRMRVTLPSVTRWHLLTVCSDSTVMDIPGSEGQHHLLLPEPQPAASALGTTWRAAEVQEAEWTNRLVRQGAGGQAVVTQAPITLDLLILTQISSAGNISNLPSHGPDKYYFARIAG